MTREELERRVRLLLPLGSMEAEAIADDVIRLVVEACADAVRPTRPRPCDCDVCFCQNSGDLADVTAWDQATANAELIRATFLPQEARDGEADRS